MEGRAKKIFTTKDKMDMTHGPLLGKILIFSLPLMASNVLQLLFNAADTVVVGRFAGTDPLAAMSATIPLIYLVTNLLIGLAVGVNVIMSRDLGMGGREEEISRTLHTSIVIGVAGGVLMAAAGMLISKWMLGIMSCPDDILPLALLYIRIYFVGTPFTLIYNYGAAALRAYGDTQRPLIYLTISGVINVLLNLFMVVVLGWGVAGVAIATVISQIISALLVIRCLIKKENELHLSLKMLGCDKKCFKEIMYVGLPAGIQACLFSLSNIAIQGAVNSYGSVAIAAVGAAESIESFMYISMNSFHQAAQTFISQNKGAGKYDRIGKVLRICLLCTLIIGVTQSLLVARFAEPLISIYNSDAQVIAAGAIRLRRVASVYFIFGLADVLVGAIRGYGIPIIPVIVNLLGTCVFRLVWVWALDLSTAAITMVYLSYPVSWVIILCALAPIWLILRRREHSKVKKNAENYANC